MTYFERFRSLLPPAFAAVVLFLPAHGFGGEDIQRGDVVVALANTTLEINHQVIADVPQGAQLQVIATSGDWIGVALAMDGRQREGWVERRFLTTAIRAAAYGSQTPPNVYGLSTITFDNQLPDPAMVRLVGPTRGEVFVPNGGQASIHHVAAGSYVIYARSGKPGEYRYSRGDRFEVQGSGQSYSRITITLHKVPWGNYGSQESSADEFNRALR
jgi:hypothetical protein